MVIPTPIVTDRGYLGRVQIDGANDPADVIGTVLVDSDSTISISATIDADESTIPALPVADDAVLTVVKETNLLLRALGAMWADALGTDEFDSFIPDPNDQ